MTSSGSSPVLTNQFFVVKFLLPPTPESLGVRATDWLCWVLVMWILSFLPGVVLTVHCTIWYRSVVLSSFFIKHSRPVLYNTLNTFFRVIFCGLINRSSHLLKFDLYFSTGLISSAFVRHVV